MNNENAIDTNVVTGEQRRAEVKALKDQKRIDHIKATLFAPSIRAATPPDPALAPTTTLLKRRIPLDQLDEYRFNSRQAPNPSYPEILQSILDTVSDNLDLNLLVARRPETGRYEPTFGGNTRRRALIEAWQRTGDTRFFQVAVTEEPWPGDIVIQARNLTENENRSDLTLRDKARALVALKAAIEQERGELSQRAFCEVAKTLGYKVDQGDFSRMSWAVAVLDPHLPQAMAGLVRDQLRSLRQIADAYQTYYYRYTRDRNFDAIFGASLSDCDGETLDFNRLHVVLGERIAAILGHPHVADKVSGAAQGIMGGEPVDLMAPPLVVLEAEANSQHRPSFAEKLVARAAERRAKKLTLSAVREREAGPAGSPVTETLDPRQIPAGQRAQEIERLKSANRPLVHQLFTKGGDPRWVEANVEFGSHCRMGFRLKPEALRVVAPEVGQEFVDSSHDRHSLGRSLLWLLHYLGSSFAGPTQANGDLLPGSLYAFTAMITAPRRPREWLESLFALMRNVQALHVLYAEDSGK